MDYQNSHVITLANSIIGVSLLAMPYCFKQCGIILSILMLLISNVLSRVTCHFLLKSAISARSKTFEFLAFHIFGSLGKFAVEIGLIGFLLGTCVAYFVVMGDLAPEIIAEITEVPTTDTLRTSILIALTVFCVLPLALLKNIDSLLNVSKATVCFYCCLVLKIIIGVFPGILTEGWMDEVKFWEPSGVLQCLPIFSMALSCQTQLFEIYQVLPNTSLEKMNILIRLAVNLCTWVYIFVGVFGYIAFHNISFTGNILSSFEPSLMTNAMKLGFVLSLAFSFPLVIFPCRASLYSLLYKGPYYTSHESNINYIPENKFKILTFSIVFVSLIFGLLIPNIELVLGLVGSTIGVIICILFPVTCFICISPKNTNERILAQIILFLGVLMMVLGTYANLHAFEEVKINIVTEKFIPDPPAIPEPIVKEEKINIIEIPTTVKTPEIVKQTPKSLIEPKIVMKNEPKPPADNVKEIRHEPPQPIEPVEISPAPKKSDIPIKPKPIKQNVTIKKIEQTTIKMKEQQITIKNQSNKKNDEVDIEAIRKEDIELKEQEKEKVKDKDTNQVLIDTLQKQHEFQKEIVEQQKKLIEVIEKQQKSADDNDKAVKQIEKIVKKAIKDIQQEKKQDEVKSIASNLPPIPIAMAKLRPNTTNQTEEKSDNNTEILRHKRDVNGSECKDDKSAKCERKPQQRDLKNID